MSSDDDEVMVDITIEISTSGALSTGFTIVEWNALSSEERKATVTDMWREEAGSHDNGGMSIVTPNAIGI